MSTHLDSVALDGDREKRTLRHDGQVRTVRAGDWIVRCIWYG